MIVMILEHMHWTWQDYLAQPLWLIDTLRVKLEEEGKHQRAETEKAKRTRSK